MITISLPEEAVTMLSDLLFDFAIYENKKLHSVVEKFYETQDDSLIKIIHSHHINYDKYIQLRNFFMELKK